jgi:hypothetical protein
MNKRVHKSKHKHVVTSCTRSFLIHVYIQKKLRTAVPALGVPPATNPLISPGQWGHATSPVLARPETNKKNTHTHTHSETI